MTKLQRMTERLQATVGGQTDDPEHLLDVLIAAWEEMHREALQMRAVAAERDHLRKLLMEALEFTEKYVSVDSPWTRDARPALALIGSEEVA